VPEQGKQAAPGARLGWQPAIHHVSQSAHATEQNGGRIVY
jgi:hypothetical protein